MSFEEALRIYRIVTKQLKIKTSSFHEITLQKLQSTAPEDLGANDLVLLLDGYLSYKRYGKVNVD